MATLTLRTLKAVASASEFSVSKRDGEYRVAPYRPADPRWCEDRAYYTDSKMDAWNTLHAMIRDGILETLASKRETL